MTLIHENMDKVKENIALKGALSVNFRVINDKTGYQVSQSWKPISLGESWKARGKK